MFNTKSLDKLGFKKNKLIIENITFLLKNEDLHIIDDNKNTIIIKQVTNKNLEKIINNYFDYVDEEDEIKKLIGEIKFNINQKGSKYYSNIYGRK